VRQYGALIMTEKFIAYLGEADFHDGFVERIVTQDDTLRVTLKADSGRHYQVVFSKASSILAERPEGMMLYAVSEVSCAPPLRKFIFLNGYGPEDTDDPEDPAFNEWTRKLEVIAEGFSVIRLDPQEVSTDEI
jgi:hypothetical protein